MDISKIKIGNTTYDIKDAVAREALGGLSGAMHWLGFTVTDVASDNGLHQMVRIDNGDSTTTVYVNPNYPNITIHDGDLILQPGDVVGRQADNTEWVFSGTVWQEFGSTGSLKALAFKDTASASYTPAGTNASSSVTLSGGSSGKLVTTTVKGVSGSTTASKVTNTSSKLSTTTITGTNGTVSASKVTKSASKLVTTTITPVDGTESVSKVTKTASKLVTTTVPNVTGNTAVTIPNVTGNTEVTIPNVTSAGSASTWSFSVSDELLTISGGNGSAPTLGTALKASKVTLGTALSASKVTLGTAKTVATGALDANGGGASIISDVTISDKTVAKAASSSVTVATGSVSSDATGSDVVTGVTITDVTAAKVASAATTVATGSVAADASGATVVTGITATDVTVPTAANSSTTVATGSVSANGTGSTVVTALHTGGTAAAQTFTGTAATITVS